MMHRLYIYSSIFCYGLAVVSLWNVWVNHKSTDRQSLGLKSVRVLKSLVAGYKQNSRGALKEYMELKCDDLTLVATTHRPQAPTFNICRCESICLSSPLSLISLTLLRNFSLSKFPHINSEASHALPGAVFHLSKVRAHVAADARVTGGALYL